MNKESMNQGYREIIDNYCEKTNPQKLKNSIRKVLKLTISTKTPGAYNLQEARIMYAQNAFEKLDIIKFCELIDDIIETTENSMEALAKKIEDMDIEVQLKQIIYR